MRLRADRHVEALRRDQQRGGVWTWRTFTAEIARECPLILQDPQRLPTQYLLETLLNEAARAQGGAAQFAFASRDGIRALFETPAFRSFARRAPFHLIVGVDAITNVAALDQLAQYSEQYPRLTVRVFRHRRQNATFHPKLCWFANRDGGTAIVGSGNLTPGGLMTNWEAFGITPLSPAQLRRLQADWDGWIEHHAGRLFGVDDPETRARAALNVRTRRPRVVPAEAAEETEAAIVEPEIEPPEEAARILFAEIPGGGNRWGQANFGIATFREFFGADPAQPITVFMTHILADGSLDRVEPRPSVAVKSKNYRFELGAARGRNYPAGQRRPIGVFLRAGIRQVRYLLLLPGDAHYDAALLTLTAAAGARRGINMRRELISVGAVSASWPDCPLLIDRPDERQASG